jgi:DNA adenine methylase
MGASNKRASKFGYETEQHAKSVISYIGGKHQLIDNIVPIIEWCASANNLSSYLELCGGGARMLLNLNSSLFEHRLYNDMDLGLCKLFACLGVRDDVYALISKLEELGCSEAVFYHAKDARAFESRMLARGHRHHELDQVTAAAYTFILALQSRAADMETFDRLRASNPARRESYFKRVSLLDRFYPTLKDVEVSHGSCFELLDLHRGRSDVFAYIDPPYCPETMQSEVTYAHSFKNSDHELLVDKLLATKMMVALSGYENEIYSRLVSAGWTRLFLKNVHVSSAATGRKQNEYLWINFRVPQSLEDQISQFDYGAY